MRALLPLLGLFLGGVIEWFSGVTGGARARREFDGRGGSIR